MGKTVFISGGSVYSKSKRNLAPGLDAAYFPGKMKTVEAIIEPSGQVRLVEPVHVSSPRRALVTILEESPSVHDAAMLSEQALAEDWNRPEEDAAWAYLQPDKSS